MVVNTKQVTGRRELRYESLDDLLADAENCAEDGVKELGNWSPSQIFSHIGQSLDNSIDGFGKIFPLPMRVMLNLFMKKKFLNKAIPAGFKSPAKYQPDGTPTDEGLEQLRTAVARQNRESKRALHPGFGKLTNDEWNSFHLRHAEMHMSFLVPKKV